MSVYPNIYGSFGAYVPYGHAEWRDGAFLDRTYGVVDQCPPNIWERGTLWGYSLNATLCATIYGLSSTVQPESTRTLYIIKF